MVACPFCKTTLFLEDNAVKSAGEKSVLTEIPSIIKLGKRYKYRNWDFEAVGRIQFDYGDGLWDEWWVQLSTGEGKWISIDEGDIAIEAPVRTHRKLPDFDSLVVGETVDLSDKMKSLLVTEKDSCTCVGMEGSIPEEIHIGERHDYAHLTGKNSVLMTLEYSDGETQLYNGVWVDPFDIKAY